MFKKMVSLGLVRSTELVEELCHILALNQDEVPSKSKLGSLSLQLNSSLEIHRIN